MSTKHDGVSCDACMKNSFRLRRYKCLICYDYDLCGSCYDNGRETNNHNVGHPMQCLLTKADYDTFYSGENYSSDSAYSYTCPLCGRLGLSEACLIDHVSSEHEDGELEVICPICASQQDGHPNRQTYEFARHLNVDHRRAPLDSRGQSDDSASSSLFHPAMLFSRIVAGGGGVGGNSSNSSSTGHLRNLRRAGGGRVPPSSSSTSTGGGASTIPPSSSSAVSAYSSRTTRRNVSSFAAALAGAGNTSNAADPIADLLSQLNSVRSRAAAASVSSQLAHLEMQLQSTRAQIEQQLPGNRRSNNYLINLTGGGGGETVQTTAVVDLDLTAEEKMVECVEGSGQQGLLHRLVLDSGDSPGLVEGEVFNRASFLQELLLSTLVDGLPPRLPDMNS